MPRLNENSIVKVASATVGMQTTDGAQTVYTVPPDKKFIPTHVVIRNPTGSLAGGSDYDFGDGANKDTWKNAVSLITLTATTDCIVINFDDKFTIYDEGDEFGLKPVTGSTGDYNATMEVFGYLFTPA